MAEKNFSRYELPVIEQLRTGFWSIILGVGILLLVSWPITLWPDGRFFAMAATFAVGALGLRHQLRRNAHAYLEGRSRPRNLSRTPHPIREAASGEVHRRPRPGFRGLLGRMLGRVRNYCELPEKIP